MRPDPVRLVLAVAAAAVLSLPISAAAGSGAGADAPRVERSEGAREVPQAPEEVVVLLHGLGRSAWSMGRMAEALREEGYRVVNLGYPSRELSVPSLADTVAAEIQACCADAPTLHFVTHSLGGILVRIWVERRNPTNLGRVVMLSPPNQGSDVVERIPNQLLELVMGPASVQLGTDSGSVPLELPPVEFELGIITGDRTLNPLFSWWLAGEDDGIVAVENAWVQGADDFLVLPYTHTFIMRRDRVIQEVVTFLGTGEFGADSHGTGSR